MTIAYISTPYFADCDFPLVKELRKQGCKIIHLIPITPKCLKSTLIDINKQYPHDGIFKANIYNEITKYTEYVNEDTYIINRTYTNKSILKRVISTNQVYKFIRSFQCDYIWTSLPFGLTDLQLYLFPKIVLTVHDPFPHTGEKNLRRTIVERIAYRLCNKFVLLNNKQADKFIKVHHINPQSIVINKLGTYDCIRLFNTPTNKINNPYILFYGRISPYKGIEYLLEAFVRIHTKYPELHLIVAGSGDYHFDISKYQNLSYIEFRNYHIGMQESAQLFYNAKFIVCPYLDATQSGVVMTAYTMNKTIIATKVGALEESVINNETGILVSPKNSQDLYDAIIALYESPQKIQELEQNIEKRYSTGIYSWSSIAQKYISFLTKEIK
jgi:glycosyltransferase involved in cell wall biosynthesis